MTSIINIYNHKHEKYKSNYKTSSMNLNIQAKSKIITSKHEITSKQIYFNM